MKGKNTLEDVPFRYGGLFRDYSQAAEYFHPKPRCFCCGFDLHKRAPYAGGFKITKGKNKGKHQFRLLCRACAYLYGRGVIEMDAVRYFNPRDYKGELFTPKQED